jgi:hypothetical protein
MGVSIPSDDVRAKRRERVRWISVCGGREKDPYETGVVSRDRIV